MKHLLCFSNFEIGCYIDSPIFEDFVEFAKSNMGQLDEASLNKMESVTVFIFDLEGTYDYGYDWEWTHCK